MGFWSIAAPIIGSVIGAAGQNKAARAAANSGKLDLGHLRAQAKEHGFNPLTVLQATGGAGSMTQEAPGFLSFLAGNIGNTISNIPQTISNTRQAKADLDLTNSQITLNQALTQESIAAGSVRTGERETDFMDEYLANPDGYTMMRTINGKPVEVRNDVLHRLGLPPGSLYGMAEDAEMVFGEIGAEATGIGNIGDSFKNPVVRDVGASNVRTASPITVSTLKPADAVMKGIDEPLLPPFLQKMYEGEWWKKNMWLD